MCPFDVDQVLQIIGDDRITADQLPLRFEKDIVVILCWEAISNSRLVSMDEDTVSFQWKDYAHGQQTKVMRLTTEEFLRRFLLHVLPKSFVRIRHYGLLASVNVSTKLERCRQLLGQQAQPESPPPKNWMERILEWTGQDPMRCPHCQGRLQRRPLAKQLPAKCRPLEPVPVTPGGDDVVQVDSS